MGGKDSNDDKKVPERGLDLSKLGLEMSDEERASAQDAVQEAMARLSDVHGLRAAQEALAGVTHGAGLTAAQKAVNRLVDPHGLSAAQEAVARLADVHGLTAAQEAMARVSGTHLSAAQRVADSVASIQNVERQLVRIADSTRLSNTIGLNQAAYQSIMESMTVGSLFSRISADLERHSRMFESVSARVNTQLGILPDVMRRFESTYALGMTRALDLPQIGVAFAALDMGQYARIFENANTLRGLGLDAGFGGRFGYIATGLTEQMQALSQISNIASAQLDLGLSSNIHEMLARTLAAQEALAEQEKTPIDETTRQRISRQLQLLCNIITILSFFMMIALEIEDRLSDGNEAIRANTETMQQMQGSIDILTTQLKEMTASQEAATEQDRAADAAIADLLTQIADSLSNQANEGDEGDQGENTPERE